MASGVINTVTDQLATLTSKTSKLSSDGKVYNGTSIEFVPWSSAGGNGGYLDFHYNQSTADYTSRIIEDGSGKINVVASSGLFVNSLQTYVLRKTVTFNNWHNMLLMRTDSTAFLFYANGLHIAPISGSNIYKSGSISITQMTKINGANSYTGAVTISAVYQRSDCLEIIANIAGSVTGNGLVVLSGTITVN